MVSGSFFCKRTTRSLAFFANDSSTFTEEKRITAGTHGLGAKLTNIYSKKFEVEIGDSKNKLHYYQSFENNLSKINKPKIKKYSGKDYVKITFNPDYQRFGLENLTNDIKALFQKRAYDIAGVLPNVTIHYNDKPIEMNSFTDYAKLYFEKGQEYVSQTYQGHYTGKSHEYRNVQTIDLMASKELAAAFCQANILKYGSRYGNKDGKNKKDLMKVIHYAMLLLHFDNHYGEPSMPSGNFEQMP